jgi:hypothetical protein
MPGRVQGPGERCRHLIAGWIQPVNATLGGFSCSESTGRGPRLGCASGGVSRPVGELGGDVVEVVVVVARYTRLRTYQLEETQREARDWSLLHHALTTL